MLRELEELFVYTQVWVNKSAFITKLNDIYSTAGIPIDWIKQNSIVLTKLLGTHAVIGGSIGMAITHENPFKTPGDIDLFFDSNKDALHYLNLLMTYLSEKQVYYSLGVNSDTKFVLPDVSVHYRLRVPFWLPICIMVKKTPIRYFYCHGARVQFYDDIVNHAYDAEKRDNKRRVISPSQEQKILQPNNVLPPYNKVQKNYDLDSVLNNSIDSSFWNGFGDESYVEPKESPPTKQEVKNESYHCYS